MSVEMNMEEIEINLRVVTLEANLSIPEDPNALVIFTHGSGSSRLSPRNSFVARTLNERGIATLLPDLLTPFEDQVHENRFNVALLSNRLVQVTEWTLQQSTLRKLAVGYFGASTGAASALQAATRLDPTIKAIVSRSGRPDLAKAVSKVKAPTLFIIGSLDTQVIELNGLAYDRLQCEKKMEIVEGSSHLFEEPGTLPIAADLATGWFEKHLSGIPVKRANLKN